MAVCNPSGVVGESKGTVFYRYGTHNGIQIVANTGVGRPLGLPGLVAQTGTLYVTQAVGLRAKLLRFCPFGTWCPSWMSRSAELSPLPGLGGSDSVPSLPSCRPCRGLEEAIPCHPCRAVAPAGAWNTDLIISTVSPTTPLGGKAW